MEPKFKIDIPKPCHEDWNAMTPNEKGKFCSVCNKGVVDFTEMRAVEIQTYFLKNQGQQICGRFKNEQMSATFDLLIPPNVFKQRMSFHKAFLLILFVVMGSTLFSCKNHDNATLGEVSIAQDTVESRTTVGIIIQPKDSIPEKTAEEKTVYTTNEVDKLPSFPGGLSSFYKFINTNMNIPTGNKEEQLVSFASFVIDSEGTVKDIQIIRGENQAFNNEIIRVLKSSPKWIPAELNKKKVAVSYTVPIRIIP